MGSRKETSLLESQKLDILINIKLSLVHPGEEIIMYLGRLSISSVIVWENPLMVSCKRSSADNPEIITKMIPFLGLSTEKAREKRQQMEFEKSHTLHPLRWLDYSSS